MFGAGTLFGVVIFLLEMLLRRRKEGPKVASQKHIPPNTVPSIVLATETASPRIAIHENVITIKVGN